MSLFKRFRNVDRGLCSNFSCIINHEGIFIAGIKEYDYRKERNFDELMGRERRKGMAKTYVTLTGTRHYYGSEFLESGMKVQLIKEPDNEYDREAIRVELEGIGKIGYVANSSYTVLGESFSAGRLYDKIDNKATAKVVLVLPKGVICKVLKRDMNNY